MPRKSWSIARPVAAAARSGRRTSNRISRYTPEKYTQA
jgi:hypothetical protein